MTSAPAARATAWLRATPNDPVSLVRSSDSWATPAPVTTARHGNPHAERTADLALKIFGEHNSLNALSVFALADQLGWPRNKVLQALADFKSGKFRVLIATDVVGRGILPGNMIAFGSPDSTRLADGIVEAFKVARPNSLKDVRVLFIGAAADEQRVREAVAPSSADFVFVEAK